MNMIKMNFHLFDLNVQTPNNSLNANATSSSGMSNEMKTFYDKALIKMAEPELVHDQFAQKRPIPAGNGKKIEFRKFDSLPRVTAALTEGVTPDGQSISVSNIEATVEQFGAYVTTTDMLNLTAFDNVQAETLELLASQAGKCSDTITKEVLAAATQVMWTNGKSSRTAIGGDADKLTIADIKKAVRWLKRNNAPKINDSYVAIVHPDTAYDLMKDSEWVEAQKYTTSEKIFNGEIGKMYGVRFVESTEAKIFEKAGASNADVYNTVVLGKDAYGVTAINGGGIETIVKQLGSGGTADPLNQRATMGWKLNKCAEILDDTKIVRIEHSVSA